MKVKILLLFLTLTWISLVVRVFDLSVKSNEYYEMLSKNNSIKAELSPPVRGEILDRQLNPMAINELGFKISFAPHLIKGDDTHLLDTEIAYLMSMIPTLDPKAMKKAYKQEDSSYNHTFIDVVDFIPHDVMIPLYARMNLRETIKISPSPKRLYPYGDMASHVLGYVAKANEKEVEGDELLQLLGHIGKTGIEKQYNTYLQGEAGERRIKVNAHNLEVEELGRSATKENRNLVLNIDMRLQKYMGELFVGNVGAIVVMDTKGAIYAAGSYPEYDLNEFVNGVTKEQWNYLMNSVNAPFTNKIVNGLYPPGSVIKTGLGLLYISSGILNENFNVHCTGTFRLGNRSFRCWNKHGHGDVSIHRAIAESCDDYFYKGSLNVGIERISAGLIRMGLGSKSQIDLPNEFLGTIPNRQWKRKKFKQPWYRGETLNTSIGQGDVLVTPIQIARYTALMATGRLPVPHIAHKMGNIIVDPEPKDILTPLEKRQLPLIQSAMRSVCNDPKGTAKAHISSRFPIAGKTGTAQTTGIGQHVKNRLNENEMAYLQRSHAWFTAYGPADNPQFIVTVLIEHGGHGGEVAGPIVSGIYNKLLELGYIKLGQPKVSTPPPEQSNSGVN
jgi:penicillin-binding protein 2